MIILYDIHPAWDNRQDPIYQQTHKHAQQIRTLLGKLNNYNVNYYIEAHEQHKKRWQSYQGVPTTTTIPLQDWACGNNNFYVASDPRTFQQMSLLRLISQPQGFFAEYNNDSLKNMHNPSLKNYLQELQDRQSTKGGALNHYNATLSLYTLIKNLTQQYMLKDENTIFNLLKKLNPDQHKKLFFGAVDENSTYFDAHIINLLEENKNTWCIIHAGARHAKTIEQYFNDQGIYNLQQFSITQEYDSDYTCAEKLLTLYPSNICNEIISFIKIHKK